MIRRLVLAAILILALFTGGMTWKMNRTLALLIHPEETTSMNPSYTASWVDADGITHTVTTPRNGATEPVADWAARHKENVDALKALFPPAGT